MILNFEDFCKLNEGLWSAGMKRVENGEKRLEEKGAIDKVCECVAIIMSKKMNVKYRPSLCTYEIKECEDVKSLFDTKITLDFSDLNDKYGKFTFSYNLPEFLCNRVLSVFKSFDDTCDGFVEDYMSDVKMKFPQNSKEVKHLSDIVLFICNVFKYKCNYLRSNPKMNDEESEKFLLNVDNIDYETGKKLK